MVLNKEDSISRCLIFRKALPNNIHLDQFLVVFGSAQEDGRSHESGVLRSMAPADADVHTIGCEIALNQNRKAASPPPPGPKRRYYCGFRSALIDDLKLRGDGYEIQLTLDGEGGVPAHVDIALLVLSTDKNKRATIKLEAAMDFADAFGEPVEYVCTEDCSDQLHPLSLDPWCLRRGIPRFADLPPLLSGAISRSDSS